MTLILVIGAGVAVAAVFGGLWYADTKAREKLADYADRAGLELDVDHIVIDPTTPIDLLGVTLKDPKTGAVLLEAKAVKTDLTLDQVRRGLRRPSRIVVVAPNVDATDPGRWMQALKQFRGERKTTKTQTTRPFPTLQVTDGTATIDVPGYGKRRLTDIAATLSRTADGTWRAAADLVEEDGRTIEVDAVAGGGHPVEGGATFDPPLSVEFRGRTATLASAWARVGEAVRLRGVTVRGDGIDARADQITLQSNDDAASASTWSASTWFTGAVDVEIRKAQASRDGQSAQIDRVTIALGPGPRDAIPGRLTAVEAFGVDADSKPHHAAVRAGRVAVELAGLAMDQPLSTVSSVTADEADIAVALDGGALYERLRPVLGTGRPVATSGQAEGGGPGASPAPRTSKLASLVGLLSDARPTLRLNDSSMSVALPGQKGPAIVVEGLSASLRPGETDDGWAVAARGALHETKTGEKGVFEVAASTTDGSLERARIKLSGSKLAHRLAALSDSIRLTERSSLHIDLVVAPHARGRGLTASGTVGLTDMGFFAPLIHGTPVDGLKIEADLNVDIDPDAQTLALDVPRLEIMEKATLRLAATIERLDGRLPKLNVRLRMPEQPCNDLLQAIPPVMVPRLQGLVLQGTASGFFTFEVDLEKPRTYDHDLDVVMKGCKAIQYGEADVPRLNRDFVYDVREKGVEIGVAVGPGTPHYRRLKRIPRHIRMGALWTEDQRFFRHQGFVPGLIERAVVMNLEGGRYRYGGSSITQQLVKNLFLSREKTLTRKLEEAILVWLVERNVSKNRILELYLNCIEYGPSIYGIQSAARAYFGKHVEQLSPLEGAFLMGLKPYPWAGWQQYERGYVKPWWHKRLGKILTGMQKRGWITELELEASRPFDPVFLTSRHAPAAPIQPDAWAPPPNPNVPNWTD